MTEPREEVFGNPKGWVAKHIADYLDPGTKRGYRFGGWDTLLITTRGRHSGRLRRTALAYGEDDGRYVVVGSNGGAPNHPDWYLNLVARPEVRIRVREEEFSATARDATPAERPRLWELMVSINPSYEEYQRRADRSRRTIPVVVLERS